MPRAGARLPGLAGVLAIAIAVAGVPAPGASGAPRPDAPHPIAPRPIAPRPVAPRVARHAARMLLARIVLPRSARAGGSPDAAQAPLLAPGSAPAAPNLLDLHGFWRLPGAPARAIAWLERHRPAGAGASRTGSTAGHGAAEVWYAGFAFQPADRRLASERLVLLAATAKGGGTLLRADAQVVWLEGSARR